MKCMCPGCGEMIDSGRLSYDMNEFMRERITELIGKENSVVQDGCNSYFHHWRDMKNPFCMTESELWSCPESEERNTLEKQKNIVFFVSPEKLLKMVKEYGRPKEGEEEARNQFEEWLQKSGYEIQKKGYVLTLIKHGDGDIRFNEIWYGDKNIAKKRVCPNCGEEMSYYAGRYPEWTLTVLGGPRVSKSTALTACAAAFMEGRDPLIQWTLHPDDNGITLFKESYLERYKKGKKLYATETNLDSIPRVSFKVTIGREQQKSIVLTFVDLPGEFNDENGIKEEVQKKYHRIFENIDFVWYCISPREVLQLEDNDRIQEMLGYGDREIVPTERIRYNMEQLASYFIHQNRKVPVAYIMGKSDAEVISDEDKRKYGLYPDGTSTEKNTETALPLDIRKFYKRGKNVREYIWKNNRELVEAFENLFPERCYIATSAYGYSPTEEENRTYTERSYHCKEVFYWMLALRNCVDVKAEYNVPRLWGAKRGYIQEVNCKIGELEDHVREKVYHNLYMKGNYMV